MKVFWNVPVRTVIVMAIIGLVSSCGSKKVYPIIDSVYIKNDGEVKSDIESSQVFIRHNLNDVNSVLRDLGFNADKIQLLNPPKGRHFYAVSINGIPIHAGHAKEKRFANKIFVIVSNRETGVGVSIFEGEPIGNFLFTRVNNEDAESNIPAVNDTKKRTNKRGWSGGSESAD